MNHTINSIFEGRPWQSHPLRTRDGLHTYVLRDAGIRKGQSPAEDELAKFYIAQADSALDELIQAGVSKQVLYRNGTAYYNFDRNR